MANTDSLQGGVEDAALMTVMQKMSSAVCLPIALTTAIKLNVLEILARENSHLSAQQLLAFLATPKPGQPSIPPNPTAHIALDRLLRVLASHELLSSSLQHVDRHPPVRAYGLNAASRYLARRPDAAPCLAALPLLCFHKAVTDTWPFVEQAVIEGGDAFTLAHGQNIFLFGKADPEFGNLFNTSMAKEALIFDSYLLDSYDGFIGVKTLVDVGGGLGASLHAIVSKYTCIKGINFDAPHVIASAPSHSGVEHIGGDMFKSVPQGDAVLLRRVLHNWEDELCVTILTNCYKALPKTGKVIIFEAILSVEVETSPRAITSDNMDLVMFTLSPSGKERTQKEFQAIALASGFKKLEIITQVCECFVIELHKI